MSPSRPNGVVNFFVVNAYRVVSEFVVISGKLFREHWSTFSLTFTDGTCYPSIGTIAKDLKLSRRTVQRAIADLEKTGHLQKEQRWRENGGKSSLLFTVK